MNVARAKEDLSKLSTKAVRDKKAMISDLISNLIKEIASAEKKGVEKSKIEAKRAKIEDLKKISKIADSVISERKELDFQRNEVADQIRKLVESRGVDDFTALNKLLRNVGDGKTLSDFVDFEGTQVPEFVPTISEFAPPPPPPPAPPAFDLTKVLEQAGTTLPEVADTARSLAENKDLRAAAAASIRDAADEMVDDFAAVSVAAGLDNIMEAFSVSNIFDNIVSSAVRSILKPFRSYRDREINELRTAAEKGDTHAVQKYVDSGKTYGLGFMFDEKYPKKVREIFLSKYADSEVEMMREQYKHRSSAHHNGGAKGVDIVGAERVATKVQQGKVERSNDSGRTKG
jgi:hypothetical protein